MMPMMRSRPALLLRSDEDIFLKVFVGIGEQGPVGDCAEASGAALNRCAAL
jgi:hypothetical protein